MTVHRKEMLDAIMRALELEKETFDFYTRAEGKTFHSEGKRIFQWLAKSEEEHYLRLTDLYKSLSDGGRWVFYGGQTISIDTGGTDRSGFDTGDIEALEIAMDIEKKGIDFFDDLASRTTDPDGKKMLETLRDEEREHLRLIEEVHQLRKR